MDLNKAILMLENQNSDHSTSIHQFNCTQLVMLSVFVNTDSIIDRVKSLSDT